MSGPRTLWESAKAPAAATAQTFAVLYSPGPPLMTGKVEIGPRIPDLVAIAAPPPPPPAPAPKPHPAPHGIGETRPERITPKPQEG